MLPTAGTCRGSVFPEDMRVPCQKGGRGGNDGPVGSQVLFQSPPHHLRLCPQETGAATPASILHSSLSGRREHCECRDHMAVPCLLAPCGRRRASTAHLVPGRLPLSPRVPTPATLAPLSL